MISWHWPQWAMAALYVVSFMAMMYRLGAKKPLNPTTPASVFLSTVFTVGIVYILHCGGFW